MTRLPSRTSRHVHNFANLSLINCNLSHASLQANQIYAISQMKIATNSQQHLQLLLPSQHPSNSHTLSLIISFLLPSFIFSCWCTWCAAKATRCCCPLRLQITRWVWLELHEGWPHGGHRWYRIGLVARCQFDHTSRGSDTAQFCCRGEKCQQRRVSWMKYSFAHTHTVNY